MKISLLLFAALLWAPALHAQALPDAQVPPLAFVALQQLYPQARNVKWRKVRTGYQASYMQSQTRRLVRFSANGDVEATGTNTAVGALPLPIRRTLTTHYPSRTICQATEVTNARTGGITYEMATCESAISSTIILTANGLKVPRARRP
ncbi:hypothetical protein [Hymenobacter canadensis]|uniref:Beta-lactamase-inhibitor-like PepSY-like domain-containing protein n=1 Tax=Hymenobacter canadensis TaxID=2999067 RepID=A0ABY7LXK0_9BACT|nr:hypothetical protein [Hymenobacter canadensis]WBA44152.1 hypothetical protein O3303_19880 [Hymenobacter canadensis]